VGLLWYFAFLPVIILVMLLPTSVAGLGTGALAFQLLFGTVGVSPADAFALAVLFSATALIGALAGGVLFVLERGRSSGDVGRSIPS
jgi:TM2 domain-containing membrane protein YozV